MRKISWVFFFLVCAPVATLLAQNKPRFRWGVVGLGGQAGFESYRYSLDLGDFVRNTSGLLPEPVRIVIPAGALAGDSGGLTVGVSPWVTASLARNQRDEFRFGVGLQRQSGYADYLFAQLGTNPQANVYNLRLQTELQLARFSALYVRFARAKLNNRLRLFGGLGLEGGFSYQHQTQVSLRIDRYSQYRPTGSTSGTGTLEQAGVPQESTVEAKPYRVVGVQGVAGAEFILAKRNQANLLGLALEYQSALSNASITQGGTDRWQWSNYGQLTLRYYWPRSAAAPGQ
ncbi:MAG: hypothetical protein MUC97_06340 [Bernardetiaceae bacterium]|nr:hypothetical protein [Bernardetiaceae bacterium]